MWFVLSCFFKYRVLHEKLGGSRRALSFMQVSHIGYCEYFHMSRANKIGYLKRGPIFRKISRGGKYWFFRCSDWPKTKRKWKEPIDWENLLEGVENDEAFKS